jgi:hypothetical protein
MSAIVNFFPMLSHDDSDAFNHAVSWQFNMGLRSELTNLSENSINYDNIMQDKMMIINIDCT